MLEGKAAMQINKTDNSQINNILDLTPRTKTVAVPVSTDEVKVEPRTAEYIQQAINADSDAAEVERAKELLVSGQLDTPEAIRAAARNMVGLGI